MVVRGKGKFGYLDGSIPKPSMTDSLFSNWDIHNLMVMEWWIHSMEDAIGETYLFHPTAKGIWDVVSLVYSNLADSSQVFELRNRAQNLCQGDMLVTQFSTR